MTEWVMVPREPTEMMFSATRAQYWEGFQADYAAMLRAAPAAPQALPDQKSLPPEIDAAMAARWHELYEAAPQEQVEPVGYMHDGPPIYGGFAEIVPAPDGFHEFPLYAHPRAAFNAQAQFERVCAEVQRLRDAAQRVASAYGGGDGFEMKAALDALRAALEGK